MEVLATAIREEKEIQRIQTRREEVKLSLFANKMTLHTENPKDVSRKLLKFIKEFGETAVYKISTEICNISIYQ